MKILWNSTAKTTLLRRLQARPQQQAVVFAVSKRAYSSLQEAPVSPPDVLDASHFGYRVVVNRASSSMSRMSSSNNHHHHHNIQDDYEEYFQSHDMTSTTTNLDILSSPEVQEILNSQHDWDSNLRAAENTMAITGCLQDTILDGGYDSDCEELSAADCNRNAAAAVVEETASFAVVTEDTSDAVMDDDSDDK